MRIRGGDNTAKMRQNLAYSYALAGRWREARLMAAQDVPADQLDDRIEQWAQMASPDAWQHRVAALLGVPGGRAATPASRSSSRSPTIRASSSSPRPKPPPPSRLPTAGRARAARRRRGAGTPSCPPLAAAEPVASRRPLRAERLPAAFTAPRPPAPLRRRWRRTRPRSSSSAPVVQPALRARAGRVGASRRVRAAQPSADGTHLVQLGSFSSEAGARRAWSIYTRNYPELAGHEMVISEAVVRGKRYWRVSAAGFGRSTASSMCGRVRAEGEGCFAYAEGRPLPALIARAGAALALLGYASKPLPTGGVFRSGRRGRGAVSVQQRARSLSADIQQSVTRTLSPVDRRAPC